MSRFTQAEIDYLGTQRLGRLATINTAGELHVVPVSFRYNPELDTLDIGGRWISTSRKYRDVERDGRVAFVVDDITASSLPRGMEIRGRAVVAPTGGQAIRPTLDPEIIRITPTRIISWGVNGDNNYRPAGRNVE
ncbi:MAG TPA: PPOX class F420-dependent oxidoreductase [Ktedonobacterales bacterium]|jgi:pyridoxamine 5'-phosphate oxidase family protein